MIKPLSLAPSLSLSQALSPGPRPGRGPAGPRPRPHKTPKTALLAASVPAGPGHAVPPPGYWSSKPSLQCTPQAAAVLPASRVTLSSCRGDRKDFSPHKIILMLGNTGVLMGHLLTKVSARNRWKFFFLHQIICPLFFRSPWKHDCGDGTKSRYRQPGPAGATPRGGAGGATCEAVSSLRTHNRDSRPAAAEAQPTGGSRAHSCVPAACGLGPGPRG